MSSWRVVPSSILVAVALVVGGRAPGAFQAERLTSFVDPFIGTGGHGHTYPGPSLPFGMIQPGPDTRLTGWDSSSGYHHSDSRIIGFTHTHLSGTGIPDYGDVLLMPTSKADGDLFATGPDGVPGYASPFSHDEEQASPGYYAVTLGGSGVRAELTTTLRVGMHRYTFPGGRPARVVLDLDHRDMVLDASAAVSDGHEITGHRRSRSWAKDQRLYFVIRFSRPFASAAFIRDGRLDGTAQRAEGRNVRAVFDFDPANGPLLVKVAISAVSIDGARRNLDRELPGWNFEEVRQAADAEWERELAKIRVEGGTREERLIFYTALYHSLLTPNVYMDVDGQYRGRDLEVHRAHGFTYYSVFSLWDTFRALHPLLAVIDRARTADFVQTMLQQYEDAGRLPVWELSGNETDTMIGYHAVPVIADAIMKGIGGFDEELALGAMIHSADEDRAGLASYRRRGYVDGADASEDVSRTLEYAYDDWCIAIVARKLGHSDEARRFFQRAQSWRNVFDPSTGFMRARVDGRWFAPFDPSEVNSHYTEANAWQYSFFVPQDVDGLAAALGGPAALARKLDALFAADTRTTGRDQADITGLVGQYAHGNEPSHHIAYLYSFAGQPWKTQAMARRLVDTMYAARPDGEIGNDDCGQTSAWLVWSALGFYPVTPASGRYVIGSPLFPRAALTLENGRTLTISAERSPTSAAAGPYIQSASLDGRPYVKSYLDADVIEAGGTLAFAMGDRPNESWGAAPGDRPAAAVDAAPIVPVPFVKAGDGVFRGSTNVELGDLEPNVAIHYTLDGSAPGLSSPRFDGSIALSATTSVTAVAFRADGTSSRPLVAAFTRVADGRRLTLSAPYANQYNAGGPDALIDTLRGGPDFKNGRWQGYLGTDLQAVVDLGSVQPIRRIAMGFLQNVDSWILMPREVRFELSEDGAHYVEAGAVGSGVSDRATGTVTRDLAVDVRVTRARYVRVTVRRYGPLPDWHPGHGEEAWFFSDEIVVQTGRR